ncbi:MAG: hypothetical protein U0169_06180, partial [Polyangiaceae bacterium]
MALPPNLPSTGPQSARSRGILAALTVLVAVGGGFWLARGSGSPAPSSGGHVDAGHVDADGAAPPTDDTAANGDLRTTPFAVTDPRTLVALERLGVRYATLVGAAMESADALARTARHGAIVRAVTADMEGFMRGVASNDPRRPFKPAWLASPDARFELVGVVPRPDRDFVHPGSCGELRLVFRLALTNPGRPTTRLPFTLNALFAVKPHDGATCADVFRAWKRDFSPPRDARRLVVLVPPVAELTRIEIDYQSIHVPAYRTDMDDRAEYVLRAFEPDADGLREAPLFGTPREGLSAAERTELATFVVDHAGDVEAGRVVVPAKFLATRAVSRSPRGLARRENRVFSSQIANESVLLKYPFAKGTVVASRDELFARLDETTCPGCHQVHAIAGFHLLGQDREPKKHIDAIFAPGSPQFHAELPWRESLLDARLRGEEWIERPLALRRKRGAGARGDVCTVSSTSFACGPELECERLHGDEHGECVPKAPRPLGAACESVTAVPSARPEGDVVTAKAVLCAEHVEAAPDGGTRNRPAICAPNWLGFAGGTCT